MSECSYCHASFQGSSSFCCHSCELLSNWVNDGQAPLGPTATISEKWLKYNLPELEVGFDISLCPVYKKFRLYLDGLQCSSCVHLIEDFHLYCSSVMSAQVNFAKGTVEIQTKKEFGLGDLCAAIEQLGYNPTPLKEAADVEVARRQEVRSDLKRIGVAGAIAGNLMLFSIPIYAGLDGRLEFIFRWISFFIFLPLVFYAADPFYRKAWASLLVRRISIDMMIVVAFLSGFVFSTYSLIVGSSDFYFDSTASFIFLILLTRFLVKRYQDQLTKKNIFAELFTNQIYEIQGPATPYFLSFDRIAQDHIVILKKDQLLPFDGVLMSDFAEFDLAFLTGESLPRAFHKNERVLAGSRLINLSTEVRCQKQAQLSELAQSLDRIESEADFKSEIQSVTDLISHRLTLVVFSIAILFFIFTFRQLGFEAFRRCLALITIACPCAIAFGTPLAHSMALKKAARNGFYMKSAFIFEKLLGLQNIVFDKTGTLTSSELNLVKTFPQHLDDSERSIIRGLERKSNHPVALSLQKYWSDVPAKNLENLTETPGLGVRGEDGESIYRIEKSEAAMDDDSMQVNYFHGGSHYASLFFEEKIKPEVPEVVSQLYQKDFHLMMLTGDHRGRALKVAQDAGLHAEHVYAGKNPLEKRKIVQKLNPCLFVGDGLNDIEGMTEAYVSFAIKGNFDTTLKIGDIYAPKKNLNAIIEIFELAHQVQKTVKRNLFFALVYNLMGGCLALLGLINPLVAAVLMPISSLLITLNTVWSLK